MGYLTTFTVYNDGFDLIRKYPEEFAEKVYYAALKQETHDVGLSGFCNFMHVQRSRHADAHTTYVHMGNCVTEVNPYSSEFKELMKKCPDFADKLIKFLDDEVKALKKLKKEMKEKTDA